MVGPKENRDSRCKTGSQVRGGTTACEAFATAAAIVGQIRATMGQGLLPGDPGPATRLNAPRAGPTITRGTKYHQVGTLDSSGPKRL